MSNEQDTVLEVQGMTCPSCIRHVSSALTELDGVGEVDVKLRDGIVIVKHDATQAPVTQLIETLDEAGYGHQGTGSAAATDHTHAAKQPATPADASIVPQPAVAGEVAPTASPASTTDDSAAVDTVPAPKRAAPKLVKKKPATPATAAPVTPAIAPAAGSGSVATEHHGHHGH